MAVYQSILTRFTFEFSLSIAQTGAAHHVTVLSLTIPLFSNTVVITVIITPLCRKAEKGAEAEGSRRKGRHVGITKHICKEGR